jgi:hypothetical protein
MKGQRLLERLGQCDYSTGPVQQKEEEAGHISEPQVLGCGNKTKVLFQLKKYFAPSE